VTLLGNAKDWGQRITAIYQSAGAAGKLVMRE
jgi:hypothetical protein